MTQIESQSGVLGCEHGTLVYDDPTGETQLKLYRDYGDGLEEVHNFTFPDLRAALARIVGSFGGPDSAEAFICSVAMTAATEPQVSVFNFALADADKMARDVIRVETRRRPLADVLNDLPDSWAQSILDAHKFNEAEVGKPQPAPQIDRARLHEIITHYYAA